MLVTRLPQIIAILLCALICGSIYWQLAPYINNYLNDQDLIPRHSENTKQSNIVAKQNSVNKNRNYTISNYQLFGDALAPVKVVASQTEKLPETTLRLKLTGVLAGKNNLQASALIEGPDRQTQNYRIGEEIPGGATLKQVYADRVVLERSGRLENLVFEETRPLGIATQLNIEKEKTNYVPEPSHSAQANINSFNQQQTQQIKDRLSKLRSRLQSNQQ